MVPRAGLLRWRGRSYRAHRQLALGGGVAVGDQTSGPTGEMLIRGYCAAVRFSKLRKMLKLLALRSV